MLTIYEVKNNWQNANYNLSYAVGRETNIFSQQESQHRFGLFLYAVIGLIPIADLIICLSLVRNNTCNYD